ncbi:hypothetical protein SLEP1_g1282 [Rubroshorea leprosula]|uniref:Dephospho-CoA kinase n=1 Tax=Rubroshorea leprosula TaxID=152421 RepID=A0AAV5HKG0_9ROSI|nr:hypothetical protein SLEP1_g1282 [Rubroshorea leprosula]
MEEGFAQNGGIKSCENEDSWAYRRDCVRYGKSTISSLFKSCDIPVVDADVVVCDVLKMGTVGYRKVVAAFGRDMLQDNGEVDRPKLGQIVFSDASKRQLLDQYEYCFWCCSFLNFGALFI